MTGLQLLDGLRLDLASGGTVLDKFDQAVFGPAVALDQPAGLGTRSMSLKGLAGQPALLFRILAQRREVVRAGIGTRYDVRRQFRWATVCSWGAGPILRRRGGLSRLGSTNRV